MHFHSLLASTLLASGVLANSAHRRSWAHVGMQEPEALNQVRNAAMQPAPRSQKRAEYGGPARQKIKRSSMTQKFEVNGSALPFVDFDVGESYAGLLPISNETDSGEMYFWFFPSDNTQADDEILIWLNGGPGCSSLEGFLQENGPVQWQYGTYRPVHNPWTWVNLTNVVWVEQPIGTGFSPINKSKPPTNQIEVASQFLGFWKNFVDTFGLHNRKIYITGESYAGFYVPYISDAMHNETNTEYYGITGMQVNDPDLTYADVQNAIPSVPMAAYWGPMFSLNDTFMQHMWERHEACGFAKYMEEAMTFPPKGPLPKPPTSDHCANWLKIVAAASEVNPCFDIYDVTTTCPNLWDVLGFPGSFDYEPAPWVYFNRSDVKKAINAPDVDWSECSNGVLTKDTSEPSSWTVLPRVIEKNKGVTMVGQGRADFILLLNGTIMSTQGMTWNGAQGFSVAPQNWNNLYVPYHEPVGKGSSAGAGIMGSWWEERGFTLSTVDLSGHMIPQYQPSVAYRQIEYLLGRIANLSVVSDFSGQSGNFGNTPMNMNSTNSTARVYKPRL